MISQTAKHAVAALSLLAQAPPLRYLGAGEIAAEIEAPRNYLGKLLQSLINQGLVESQKGKGGGFRLARPPDRITLFDVVNPIERLERWSNCFLDRRPCSAEGLCVLHDRWAVVRDAYIAFLKSTTIAELPPRDRCPMVPIPELTREKTSMKPTERLRQEHRVIERVLDCLQETAERSERGKGFDAAVAGQMLEFFREFADRCHHGKEEGHLFPAMEAKGFPRDGGPTGVMIYEHEQGRSLIRRMADALQAVSGGDASAQTAFTQAARAYCNLLRNHIAKEDQVLFVMADQAFSAEDQTRLAAAFEKVEAEEIGAGVHEKYHRLAEELAERLGVDSTPSNPPGEAGGHSCGH
ncbi:Rrf2 family transcriptional regulator [Thermopirellula anaerolimosa]